MPKLVLGIASDSAPLHRAIVSDRPDSEDIRNATLQNLEAAGYGRPCNTGELEAHRAVCFQSLHLRPSEDSRPSTLYKSAARQSLLDRGWRLVGSIGDQYSDHLGYPMADAVFLLPNPFYASL